MVGKENALLAADCPLKTFSSGVGVASTDELVVREQNRCVSLIVHMEITVAEISLTGDQMLTVLEAVATGGPISAADIARVCEINRTVTHRLLTTLAQRAYVRRGDAGYTVGPAVLRLAEKLDVDVRAVAKPVMLKLAQETGETVVLHAIDNLEAVVIDQALGQRHLVRVEHSPGSRHPLTKGASGWSLLAFQSEKLIERLLRKSADPSAIMQRIDETRSSGFSITHDELQMGVHGVAVPVLERNQSCQVSLAILVPAPRAQTLKNFVQPLLNASLEIAGKLK